MVARFFLCVVTDCVMIENDCQHPISSGQVIISDYKTIQKLK